MHITFGDSDANNIKLVHEDITNKENLLVTVGDSWTWGDSLGKISFEDGIFDDPKRIESLYGKHIKNSLNNYDWINIGYPGTANGWIVDVALRFVQLSKVLKYKHIIIICTLTDMVRDFGANDIDYNFADSTIIDYWKKVEKHRLSALSKLDDVANIDLIVGRNFTHTHESHKTIVKHHLVDEWVEVNRKHWNNKWEKFPLFIGYMSRNQYNSWPSDEKKQWCLANGFPAMEKMTDFLMNCPLHYKKHSMHPTEKSHKLWGEYIMNYINKYNIKREND